jgi:Flp pilus assembly protein TadG
MKVRMRGLAGSERGSSLVETALFMPVLLTLMLGVTDFGRAYYQANELEGAAHAGAVYGSQYPTDTTDMQTMAVDNAPDGTGASASCATTPTCTGTTEVYYVKVTVSASYSPLLPWSKFASPGTLSAVSEMRSTVP